MNEDPKPRPDPEALAIRRAKRAEEGKVAMADYRAAQIELREKTKRLRQARLARAD